MKLVKKITFNRVMQLPQYKKVLSTFDKLKEDSNIDKHNSIKRTKDASKLNYFIVIEYENLFKEKFNLKNIFEKKDKNNIINFEKILEEEEKIKKYIAEKKTKEPICFSKLGAINDVSGCYLVGTNKKNVNNIKDLDFKNKNNLILIKLDYKNLPKEIDELCNQFYTNTQEQIKKQKEEFEKFSKMNIEEQDKYITNILDNINPSSIVFIDNKNYFNYKSSGFTFYDGFSENNIDKINDIQFLETLRINAEEKEQFEFCAKIRDRLKEIRSKGDNN